MAGAKRTSLLRSYAFVVIGLVVVGLNIASAQNNSTTAAPTKKSTVITTRLPASPVNPATGYGHFNVSNCILLDISCSVSVDLHVGNEVKTVVYELPLKATASGSCSSKTSTITLSWTKGPAHLSLIMKLENGDNNWETSSLVFTAKADQPLVTNGTEKKVNAWKNDTSDLKMTAGSGKSFKCDQNLKIVLQGKVKVTVMIEKMQLQPFYGEGKGDAHFGEADVCSAKTGGKPEAVDSIVPTAVGCVLAGLVVILIITYFVGRCKRPGYEKM